MKTNANSFQTSRTSSNNNGYLVSKTYRELKTSLSADFHRYEFHEQYESVLEASGGRSYFGIGVLVRKNWLV